VRGVLVLLAVSTSAHADPHDAIRARAERLQEQHGPWLELEPIQAPDLESSDAKRDRKITAIAIGDTLVLLRGDWWEGDRDDPQRLRVDQPGHGWRTGIRLARDLGFAKLSGGATVGHVDTQNGSGTYRQVDVSLSRSVRLSRWMTGFISLGVGYRRWVGVQPPAGEWNGFQTMLTIGTTFR
jgi:hypothetical protein